MDKPETKLVEAVQEYAKANSYPEVVELSKDIIVALHSMFRTCNQLQAKEERTERWAEKVANQEAKYGEQRGSNG